MNEALRHLFLDAAHAFDHPVTGAVTIALAIILALTPGLVWLLAKTGKVNGKLRHELMLRYWSWVVLVPLMMIPILLGAGWTMLAVGVLSLLCYREYSRATGLFREKIVSVFVVGGIVLVTFASLDHWYRLFVALGPITIGFIAMAAILRDQPKGYIQRVALGSFGFLLFGSCLGHLGYLANDINYRPILILTLLSVELNDVFAFITGKTFGRRKLVPNTSPGKTEAGSIGALVLTTLLVVGVGRFVFAGTPLAHPFYLAMLGLIVSITGQFGDLMLSSIKRDVGIKDMAATIPGHGGLLDRFDSLILVAPAVFHFVNYINGVGADRVANVLTGTP